MMTVMLRAECELHVSGVDSPRLTWNKGVKPGLRGIKRVCILFGKGGSDDIGCTCSYVYVLCVCVDGFQ